MRNRWSGLFDGVKQPSFAFLDGTCACLCSITLCHKCTRMCCYTLFKVKHCGINEWTNKTSYNNKQYNFLKNYHGFNDNSFQKDIVDIKYLSHGQTRGSNFETSIWGFKFVFFHNVIHSTADMKMVPFVDQISRPPFTSAGCNNRIQPTKETLIKGMFKYCLLNPASDETTNNCGIFCITNGYRLFLEKKNIKFKSMRGDTIRRALNIESGKQIMFVEMDKITKYVGKKVKLENVGIRIYNTEKEQLELYYSTYPQDLIEGMRKRDVLFWIKIVIENSHYKLITKRMLKERTCDNCGLVYKLRHKCNEEKAIKRNQYKRRNGKFVKTKTSKNTKKGLMK
ncbi:hypothetical protein RFI_24539 [Reticulomyxa filosa]|uniref:Uncharacterized protein n=1 Tax=Reticulomyxa filosa TaxID=46433 RepID=X6MFP8_RETFI|nr:hypothetical protein RFI_24539 [Reticulomyxa filosa]|eukprot:ETO12833.1 hypothetical protein RFI_24539 [Reticulomyxa filosa]